MSDHADNSRLVVTNAPGMSTTADVFNTAFDVAIVGQGYAAYAAALLLHQQGRRVVLIGELGDLLWESGRAMHTHAGHTSHPLWNDLLNTLRSRNAAFQRPADQSWWIDPPQAEAHASDTLFRQNIAALYYAKPVQVQLHNHAITSLTLATKSGLRRVHASQWIDATEHATLATLAFNALHPQSRTATSPALRQPSHLLVHLHLQHANWANVSVSQPLQTTGWETERVLTLSRPVTELSQHRWRLAVLDALQSLADDIGDAVGEVSMTHLSFVPLPVYEASASPCVDTIASNLAIASPAATAAAVSTLADRFTLGLAAAASLQDKPAAVAPIDAAAAVPAPAPCTTRHADVVVAGAGTGGAPAAIAAGRIFARNNRTAAVLCVEQAYYPGGIGTAGGIHSYYFGIPGGLQQDIDRRTRDLMFKFKTPLGDGPLADGPFNPWAKTIAFQQLLEEARVEMIYDAQPFAVHTQGRHVTAIDAATSQGVLRINANHWIDATGDGDLCVMAGASFNLGRENDGLTHAYSQPCGKLRFLHGRPRMTTANFDAGFVDPTDPQDLTRARIAGVRLHVLTHAQNDTRQTYITPAIGLRQSRHIHTRYTLTLDDQIMRRSLENCIGYSGSHYDNHATDLEFESDEGMFWVWINEQFMQHFSHEISYGMILPDALDNVTIASRCAGVSQDAHHSMRMQRDMQRLGEAAGYASALALLNDTDAASLPFNLLHAELAASGALDRHPRIDTPPFGSINEPHYLDIPAVLASKATCLEALDNHQLGPAIWWLSKNPQHVSDEIHQRLQSGNDDTSWLAACVAAMWGDPAAQPRLLRAIDTLEYGYDDITLWQQLQNDPAAPRPTSQPRGPMFNPRMVPRWMAAVALLRRCGNEACLDALLRLTSKPVHGINAITTLGLTLAALHDRITPSSQHAATEKVQAILDTIPGIRLVGQFDLPQRFAGRYAHFAVTGAYDDQPADKPVPELAPWGQGPVPNSAIDTTWQLELALGKAAAAWSIQARQPAAVAHAARAAAAHA